MLAHRTLRAFVLSLSLASGAAACGGVRETMPLQYPGDGRTTADSLGEAISRRGYGPTCKPREYCKFQYGAQGTIHFKLKPGSVVVAIDVAKGDDMPPAELQKLQADMRKLAQEIWDEARPVAMAREEAARKADEQARIEAARRAEGQARIDAQRRAEEQARLDAQRRADEAARLEAERQAALVVYDAVTLEAYGRGAAFKILTPEGITCRVEGDSAWAAPKQLEVPFQIPALRDVYYTFECPLSQGASWRKKLQAKDGYLTVIRLSQGAPPPGAGPLPPSSPGPGHPPPHHHGPAAPAAMDAASFSSLKAAIDGESFSDGKIKVIQLSATSSYYTCAQVGALLDSLTFSEDKLRALRLVQSRIVDRQNVHTILSHFTFSADKDAATKILTP